MSHAQKGALPVPAKERYVVPHRWLPKELWDRYWTQITDESVIAKGDWLFNPAMYAHYAGQVTDVTERTVVIRWVKEDEETKLELRPALNAYWRMTEA